MAAELLAPKWFDKNPALSNEDNFEQLRAALGIARALYLDGRDDTALRPLRPPLPGADRARPRARPERPGRALRPGPARPRRCSTRSAAPSSLPFHEAVRRNLVGLGATDLCPDLAGFDFDAFLAGLQPGADDRRPPHRRPGRPDHAATTRPSASATACRRRSRRSSPPTASAGSSSRSPATSTADVERLARIAGVLDRIDGGYRCSLDGNEQYDDIEGVLALWRRMHAEPRLARLCASVAFVEQPIKRQTRARAGRRRAVGARRR